ncbi:MAG TPA: amidase family protein, partial [Acidimicrobiales bacterium]
MDFRRTTVAEIAEQVATRAMSAREVVQAALDRIERYDDKLGAFVAVDGDSALADAAAIDARIAGGEDVGALAGVPLAVKDLE